MVDLKNKNTLKKVGLGLVVGGACLGGVALVSFAKGYNFHVKQLDKKMLDIAREVSDGSVKTISMTRCSGEKFNAIFFGEKGVPKETIKYLKNFGKEVVQS